MRMEYGQDYVRVLCLTNLHQLLNKLHKIPSLYLSYRRRYYMSNVVPLFSVTLYVGLHYYSLLLVTLYKTQYLRICQFLFA